VTPAERGAAGASLLRARAALAEIRRFEASGTAEGD
jgi:hypothetical protein